MHHARRCLSPLVINVAVIGLVERVPVIAAYVAASPSQASSAPLWDSFAEILPIISFLLPLLSHLSSPLATPVSLLRCPHPLKHTASEGNSQATSLAVVLMANAGKKRTI